MLGIIGLMLGTVVLIIGAYKGLGVLPLSLLAGAVVVVTNGMDLWTSFSQVYITGYVGFFTNFFLIFASSALYAKIMEESGSAIAIGYKFIDWFGAKRAVLVVLVSSAALTYGGVSLFVVVFAIAPIIMVLFNAADIPRRLAMGPLLAGSATFTMTLLPGTPQLTNVVPTNFLGTSLTAAPVLGIVGATLMFTGQYLYLSWEERRLRAAGEHFTFIEGADISVYQVERDQLPSAIKAFAPMIIVVGMIMSLRTVFTESAQLIVTSMIVASTVAIIFNWERLKDKKALFNTSAAGAVTAISAPCAIVGFGAIVQHSPSFQMITDWVLNLDMNIYVMAAVATAVISGITGSSSGGLLITLGTLSEQYIASGADLEIIHRLSAVFAGTLDTLPHSSALFLMFAYLGLTHKDGYRFVFLGSVVIPTMVSLLLLAGVVVLGL